MEINTVNVNKSEGLNKSEEYNNLFTMITIIFNDSDNVRNDARLWLHNDMLN